jgi:hypothetical protein
MFWWVGLGMSRNCRRSFLKNRGGVGYHHDMAKEEALASQMPLVCAAYGREMNWEGIGWKPLKGRILFVFEPRVPHTIAHVIRAMEKGIP